MVSNHPILELDHTWYYAMTWIYVAPTCTLECTYQK